MKIVCYSLDELFIKLNVKFPNHEIFAHQEKKYLKLVFLKSLIPYDVDGISFKKFFASE